MYNERINFNMIMTEIGSEIPMHKVSVDGKGRGRFRVKTFFNFINKRMPYDLMMGYYISSLSEGKKGKYRKIAAAVIPATGEDRINATHEGEFITEEIMFIDPGEYALELFVCERPDLGGLDEDEFDYRAKGFMVSSYFFEV